MASDPPKASKNPFCAPLNTSFSKSPFNAFVTNELSPLTQANPNNPKGLFSRPIKKFSFSEQIHDFVLQQDSGNSNFIKEKDNLESYLNEDNSYSPLLGINKLSHQQSLNFEENNLNDIVNNKNSNIIENMLGI